MPKTIVDKTLALVYYTVLFALFFLAGFNLLALRGVYLIAAFGLSFLRLFLCKQAAIRPALFFIAGFSLSLATVYCYFASFSIVQFLMIGILPVLGFMIGQSTSNAKVVFSEFALMALGYALTVVVNFFVTRAKGAIIDEVGIYFYFDAQLQAESPRTYVSIDFILCLALSIVLFCLATKKNWPINVFFGCFLFLAPMVINVFVGNRSLLLVAASLIVLLPLYLSVMEPIKKRKKVAITLIVCFLIIAVLSSLTLATNLFGIRETLNEIPAFSRFSDKTGSGRIEQYKIFLQEWLHYPTGGMFVDNLFGDGLFGPLEIHNTFLQVYSIGGWFPFLLETFLLLAWFRLVFTTKITKTNRFGIIASVSLSVAFFVICLVEPMITSEPFICSMFFLCAGYLYGEWSRQRNRKPLLSIGLSHNGGPSPSRAELIGKLTIALGLIASTTVLSVFSDYGAAFSVIGLLLLALSFVLFDKRDYGVASIVKTIACLAVAAVFTVFLNIYLSINTWMYALAKSALSITVFVFLRIIMVSRSEEKDGYYRLRNFFTKLARDIDGSPEENLVSQDLQTNNEGE